MSHKELTLDPRTQSDLCRRVEELAASYAPEWRFDRQDPDVGSTLALIYTGQMADNIRRMNQLPEKYRTEFANLLGLTLQSAYPAAGVVVVDLMQGTVPGIALPKGTRLMAEGRDGNPILFETDGDIYLTNSRITDILSLSGEQGRISPLHGNWTPVKLVPNAEQIVAEQTEETVQGVELGAFRLFDYTQPGIEKNALLLYHRNVFGTQPGIPVLLRLVTPDGEPLAKELADPACWRWSYYDGEKLQSFDRVEVRDGLLYLNRAGESQPLNMEGTDYHLICLEALQPVHGAITAGDVRVASCREDAPPELILHEGEALEAEECMPLGNTVSLFDECYVCDDQVFAQQGAKIKLSFRLSNQKKVLLLTAQQEKEELKVIKRKPRAQQYETASTSPERVSLEYFNGQFWRTLPCEGDWSTLFDGTHHGEFQISFRCPEDWAAVPINGYEGRSLRLRVTQADNCYLLPCEHTMPVWQNVRLSYVYDESWKQPQMLRTVCGTAITDQTRDLLSGDAVTLFRQLPYPEASLYLGFDSPLEGAPISMLFDVEENVHFATSPVSFEYSTRTGFKAMRVVDRTDNFAKSGTVLFMPPSDFAAVEVEGVRRWWLRLRAKDPEAQNYHPLIRGIRLNAVDIRNRQTQMEQSLYVESSIPNMRFRMSAQNILSAEVFISEQPSRYQMRQMMEQQPDDVRVERDFRGEITAFYVRWTEVENFDRSGPEDRHFMIDRVRNDLVFGDGVHVRLPQQGASISVQAVSCDGSRGNVPAGAINSFFGNVMYVESVANPEATYAGSDLENVDSACRRGAELISCRGRLISQMDFVRAVKGFSGMVEKVKCLAGVDLDGNEDPSRITIAVMTRDYAAENNSFHGIREPLLRKMLSQCDATMSPECLTLAEPVYVEISVSVWVKADSDARAFDIQNQIQESIQRFLEPMERPGYSGWEIGTLPSERQIRMVLQSLRFQGHVERIITTARYVDQNGVHEASLDQLPATPFAIGISGEHRVHIEFQ